jgi:hypothetical protein
MSSSSSSHNFLRLTCILLALVSLASFAYRNHKDFYQTPIDFLIFLHAGENFQHSGHLYERADNYADKYHPTAAIYKFPPAFQLMLMPLNHLPTNISLYVFTRLLLTGMYGVSLLILFFYMKKHLSLKKEALFYFSALFIIIACWFMPFFECIRWLLTEIPLLLLFILSFLLLGKFRGLSGLAGTLMAYAACAKIYPAFLFSYHLMRKSPGVIAGFLIGTLLTLGASLYYFGLPEHLFYLKNILPVLLKEPVSDKWVNLNLENFLFQVGYLPEVTGKVFQFTRLVFVGAGLLVLWRHAADNGKTQFLLFCFCITTMFFCFPNYWPQYQIFLILPVVCLLAYTLRYQQSFRLWLLLLITATLCVPDLLWKQVLEWDLARQGLDMDMVGRESYEQGNSITLLKYSPLTWCLYYGYTCRALTPVVLWLMQALQLHSSSTPSSA